VLGVDLVQPLGSRRVRPFPSMLSILAVSSLIRSSMLATLLSLAPASVLTAPLEVVGVVSAFSFSWGGVAGALAFLKGQSGDEIAAKSAEGFAAGFIVGLLAGAAAALYLVTN
jgi:hypothetical protein